jgi:hypothetical protein
MNTLLRLLCHFGIHFREREVYTTLRSIHYYCETCKTFSTMRLQENGKWKRGGL